MATVEIPKKHYVYGLAGLAKLLDCSIDKASKIRGSGIVPHAKIGRRYVFDKELVLSALNPSHNN